MTTIKDSLNKYSENQLEIYGEDLNKIEGDVCLIVASLPDGGFWSQSAFDADGFHKIILPYLVRKAFASVHCDRDKLIALLDEAKTASVNV